MAIEGKVRTLYTDKTQQEAIFPTTKVSAVTDDEGNGLNTLLEHIAYVDPMDMESAAVLANADLLGGYPASDYAFIEDLKNLKPEDIGAAPGGYGLGSEYARSLNSTSDLNLITQNGWYSWRYNSIPKNAPTHDNLFLDNMFVMGSGASCIQLVFDTQDTANTGTILKRVNYGGDYFSNWEYINPPMFAGISYRTTERYMGRPVFMIAVNLGNTPAAGATKDIPHGIPDVETVIDYWGTYANQQAIFNNDNIDTILVTPTVVRVKMSSAAGNGGYNLSMVFKYIKNGI